MRSPITKSVAIQRSQPSNFAAFLAGKFGRLAELIKPLRVSLPESVEHRDGRLGQWVQV